MEKSTVHGAVFCLIRTLPLLDVLDSPIKAAVEDVVEGSLSGNPVPDAVLIALDDYRQACGDLRDVYNPVYLQSSVASVAILVSEAQWPRYYPKPRSPYLAAESVWQRFDASLAKARGLSAVSLSDSAFAQEERSWQEADRQAIVRAETDPSALTRHLGLLKGRFEATRSALAELVAEFGWTPGGPCGGSCDWPTCRAERSECVRYRPFQQTLAGELRRRQGAEPKKWYVQVWHSNNAPDEPYETVSEIGADGHELRKVAYFDDEHVEWADTSGGIGTLVLSGQPVPPLVELAARDDCWAEEITQQHFEEWWAKAQADPRRSFLPE